MRRRIVSFIAAFVVASIGCSSAQVVMASPVEDQYLVGDWDGDGKDNIAIRRGNTILMDTNFDGTHNKLQVYGDGNSEDQYLVGDWNGDGKDNIAIRRGNKIYMNYNFDGKHDRLQVYGNGNSDDQYLVGDWNGDGKDNIAIRRGNKIYMDTNFDGKHDKLQSYGNGNLDDQYLVGDWNGDGKDNIAIRKGNKIYMDTNFDGKHDILQNYGNGNLDDQYLSGDWNGDRRSNVAIRKGYTILMDNNFNGTHDIAQNYGHGTAATASKSTPIVVSVALSKVGVSYQNGYCLRFVKECFNQSYNYSAGSACCAKSYADKYLDSTSMANIPLGADVFFSGSTSVCSTCRQKCGHIAIYVGDGYIVHAWDGKIVKTKITDIDNSKHYDFIGWGYHDNIVITG